MIAQRVLRTPSWGFCIMERRMMSMQQATDLPDPKGPRTPRTNSLDRMKAAATGPGAL
jgi:hypothetical protein